LFTWSFSQRIYVFGPYNLSKYPYSLLGIGHSDIKHLFFSKEKPDKVTQFSAKTMSDLLS